MGYRTHECEVGIFRVCVPSHHILEIMYGGANSCHCGVRRRRQYDAALLCYFKEITGEVMPQLLGGFELRLSEFSSCAKPICHKLQAGCHEHEGREDLDLLLVELLAKRRPLGFMGEVESDRTCCNRG